jgi:hypothetical protein
VTSKAPDEARGEDGDQKRRRDPQPEFHRATVEQGHADHHPVVVRYQVAVDARRLLLGTKWDGGRLLSR